MNFAVLSPQTRPALLKAMRQNVNFRFGAGYTDLLMELKKTEPNGLLVINLAQLTDKYFLTVRRTSNFLRIGSLVTAASIVRDPYIEKQFPVLHEAANNLASAQIRQLATVGGNLCTASPSGDIACALVALESTCEILASDGSLRTVSISKFFTGPRKTVLHKNEILRSVTIPLNKKGARVRSGFIKVGTRRSMECSVVSLAYHIQDEKKGSILHAGAGIGAVAPVIMCVEEAANVLTGHNINAINEKEQEAFAQTVLQYASPITDLRASAWYRREVLHNISKSIFNQ